ncbi:MAG: hypothetical protein LBE51_16160 [Acidovorax sp.]|jgi:hypothetical protein|nr:hypothetical protein [Acidovorax sp.]
MHRQGIEHDAITSQPTTMSQPIVRTMHWDNIPARILEKQKAVFAHLGIPLQQDLADKKPHGRWMNEVLAQSSSDDVIVICDIDAFPLNRQAYLRAVAHAQSGGLFGLAQFSNHKPGNEIYAGPMFMAFRKSLWEQVGQPDLLASKLHDAAEVMTVLAHQHHAEVLMSQPTACLQPKWALANKGVFGIGTFYGECDFFHLFESRKPSYDQLLSAVADDVLADRALQFTHYLELTQQLEAAPKAQARHWWQRWTR